MPSPPGVRGDQQGLRNEVQQGQGPRGQCGCTTFPTQGRQFMGNGVAFSPRVTTWVSGWCGVTVGTRLADPMGSALALP